MPPTQKELTPDKIRKRVAAKEVRIVYPDMPEGISPPKARRVKIWLAVCRQFMGGKSYQDIADIAFKNKWVGKPNPTKQGIECLVNNGLKWLLEHGGVQTRKAA